MSDPIDKGWVLNMERQFDERDELREKVKYNADMYRRDVQFALDLIADAMSGTKTLSEIEATLTDAYKAGRQELKGV